MPLPSSFSTSLAVAAVAATLAAAAPASAGSYIGAGLGTSANLHGSMGQSFSSDQQESNRFTLGQRIGPLALEGSYSGAGLTGLEGFRADGAYTSRTVGLDLKLHIPFALGFGIYGKGGVTRTWLDAPDSANMSYTGSGWDIGGGLQYDIDLIAAGIAVWLDYTRHTMELREAGRPALDGGFGLVSLGLTVSFF